MGDRGNFLLRYPGGKSIFLYTHWSGESLPGILARSVKRGMIRLGDPAYFARILFCDLVGSEFAGTDGYGISTRLEDNDNPVLVVDLEKARFGIISFDNAAGLIFDVKDWRPLKHLDRDFRDGELEWGAFRKWFRSKQGREEASGG